MFLYFNPLTMDKPKVWVKVKSEIFGNHYGEDKEEVSLFVDNNALVLSDLSVKKPGLRDKWYISDPYYGKMVRDGKFVPIEDLNGVEGICLEMGWPKYEIELPF